MIPSVSVKDIKTIIHKYINLKNKDDLNIPTIIWGNHGIGKTSIVKQIAADLDMNISILNGSLMSPEDILGVPTMKSDGGYHLPSFLPRENDKPTILFIDELNRSPKFLLQSLFGLILTGEIHNKQVIRKCDYVIAACNPPSENYEVTEFDDDAFLSRFSHFSLSVDKNEFMSYLGTKVKNNIIQNMLTKGEAYKSTSINIDYSGSLDNRNLERCGLIIDKLDNNEILSLGMLIFSSLVGHDGAGIIMNTIREKINISFKNIIESSKCDIDINDISLLNNIINSSDSFFNENKKALTKNKIKNLDLFIQKIPRDLAVKCLGVLESLSNETVMSLVGLDMKFYEDIIMKKE